MGVKGIRKCKVCGKEYEYCHTFRPTTFRWQDVACCLEHGNEYFAQIAASRGETFEGLSSPAPAPKTATVKEPEIKINEPWENTPVVEPEPVEVEENLVLEPAPVKEEEDSKGSGGTNEKIKQKKLFMSLKNIDLE